MRAMDSPPPFNGLQIGLQSHTLRSFDLPTVVGEMSELGLQCVEFPRPHLPLDDATKRAEAIRLCRDSGIAIVSCGVMPMEADEAACRAVFEHARALGVELISVFPEPDALAILNDLAEEYGVRLAIHNAGPDRTWSNIESVERALGQCSQRIGACVDTGHFTRMGIDPLEALNRFDERVFIVHLKDRGLDRDGQRGEEFVVGDGPLDLEAILDWLVERCFCGPVLIEYEEIGLADPRPKLREAVRRISQILS